MSQMFRFEHQDLLYFELAAIPLAILFYMGWRWYRTQQSRIGDMPLIKQLSPAKAGDVRKYTSILSILIFGFLVIAWANPQWGSKREKVDAKAADIFLALDISNSMFAQDVPPNRLERAKRFAERLITRLKGERIGLILFAGNAYLQMPLTTDYAAALLFVRSANPDLAGTQGTAIGEAISTAREYFDQNDLFHRTLVLITDGEDHDEDALNQAEEAAAEGMQIFTIGVGSQAGTMIPMIIDGRSDWKRDETGQPVRTALNSDLLKRIADLGNGSSFNLESGTDILSAIDRKVDEMEKREIQEHSFTAYESYFQVFVGLAIFGLLTIWILEHGVFPNLLKHD